MRSDAFTFDEQSEKYVLCTNVAIAIARASWKEISMTSSRARSG